MAQQLSLLGPEYNPHSDIPDPDLIAGCEQADKV